MQEYTDDSGESTDPEEIAIENEYFSSKALKEEDPKAALGGFQRVLELDTKKGEWGFKALKQMLKILFRMVSDRIELKLDHQRDRTTGFRHAIVWVGKGRQHLLL